MEESQQFNNIYNDNRKPHYSILFKAQFKIESHHYSLYKGVYRDTRCRQQYLCSVSKHLQGISICQYTFTRKYRVVNSAVFGWPRCFGLWETAIAWEMRLRSLMNWNDFFVQGNRVVLCNCYVIWLWTSFGWQCRHRSGYWLIPLRPTSSAIHFVPCLLLIRHAEAVLFMVSTAICNRLFCLTIKKSF